MNRKHFIALAVAASFTAIAPTTQAGSVVGFGGSTEITQLANNIELVPVSIRYSQRLARTIANVPDLPGNVYPYRLFM